LDPDPKARMSAGGAHGGFRAPARPNNCRRGRRHGRADFRTAHCRCRPAALDAADGVDPAAAAGDGEGGGWARAGCGCWKKIQPRAGGNGDGGKFTRTLVCCHTSATKNAIEVTLRKTEKTRQNRRASAASIWDGAVAMHKLPTGAPPLRNSNRGFMPGQVLRQMIMPRD